MQKTTEEEKAFLSGFPIKDFGNDSGGIASFSTYTILHALLITDY